MVMKSPLFHPWVVGNLSQATLNMEKKEKMEIKNDQYWLRLQDNELSLMDTEQFVHHNSCGAVLSFSGMTRDTFGDKKVVQLSYECYVPMALKEMERIATDLIHKHSTLRIAIHHRLGVVNVGETSVVISVATPHRAACYEASRYAIDTLKMQVPIFKKEIYEGGSTWKANQP
jgi:molybdopterin synthase catalytic subunit